MAVLAKCGVSAEVVFENAQKRQNGEGGKACVLEVGERRADFRYPLETQWDVQLAENLNHRARRFGVFLFHGRADRAEVQILLTGGGRKSGRISPTVGAPSEWTSRRKSVPSDVAIREITARDRAKPQR